MPEAAADCLLHALWLVKPSDRANVRAAANARHRRGHGRDARPLLPELSSILGLRENTGMDRNTLVSN